MVPTKERNVSGIHIFYDGEGILFDCGEGTQRQMAMADLNRKAVQKIFITHWHADHVGGLLPLIQTISDHGRDVSIDIYGPKETKKRVEHLLAATYFDPALTITVHEVDPKHKVTTICTTDKYRIDAVSLDHGVPTIGFAFIEHDRRRMNTAKMTKLGLKPGPVLSKFQAGEDVKVDGKLIKADDVTYIVPGKKFTYVPDTMFCQSAIDLAKDADLLVAESTYCADQEDKAHDHKHLTSTQTAQIAAMSGAKKLVLTHVSQRYKNPAQLLDEAKAVFPDAQIGFDLMKIKM
jgi:ribonuclease Z